MKSAFHLLRYVDHDSFVHRINARTKVSTITAMALCLALRPGWITLSAIWSLGFITFFAARLTLGTVPRFPKIVTYGLVVSFVLAFLSGGEPNIQVGPVSVAAGGLLLQARFTLVTFGLLFLSLLLGWTTSPAELPNAVHFLLRPFRFLRMPVDDVVAGLALAIRVMPLLMDELTTTFTLWRSRREAARATEPPKPTPTAKRSDLFASAFESLKRDRPTEPSNKPARKDRPDPFEQAMNDVVNIAATSTSSAVRRAGEVGLAMQAKGSTKATVSATSWGYPDLIASAVTILAVVAIFSFDR